MPQQNSDGGVSRCVHHGNLKNKRGQTMGSLPPRNYDPKLSAMKVLNAASRRKVKLEAADVVIVAPPPREEVEVEQDTEVVDDEVPVNETRFTIPYIRANVHIFVAMYAKTHENLNFVLEELRSSVQKTSSGDCMDDHLIEVL